MDDATPDAALLDPPTDPPTDPPRDLPTDPPAALPVDDTPPAGLSAREAAVLRFERRTWRYRAAKEEAIRAELGISPVRYNQLLNALLDSPAALAAEPVLVRRLARLRAERRQGWSPALPAAPAGSAADAAAGPGPRDLRR